MTDPFDILMHEHRVIERVLDAFCAFAAGAADGEEADRADLSRFIDFIEAFADKKHHAKEEAILFEAMGATGFPRHGGPIAVMMHEHDVGRALVTELKTLASHDAWNDNRDAIARTAEEFAELLRSHIQREDGILYEMARHHLPDEVMADVAEQIAEVERYYAANGETDRLEKLAASLVDRYLG